MQLGGDFSRFGRRVAVNGLAIVESLPGQKKLQLLKKIEHFFGGFARADARVYFQPTRLRRGSIGGLRESRGHSGPPIVANNLFEPGETRTRKRRSAK